MSDCLFLDGKDESTAECDDASEPSAADYALGPRDPPTAS